MTTLDGDPVWVVTSHEPARTLLGDPRLSSDRFRSRRVPASCRRRSAPG
ncbi:hypothetical protein [Saccharothrix carnea]